MYKENHSIQKIVEEMKLTQQTIISYLCTFKENKERLFETFKISNEHEKDIIAHSKNYDKLKDLKTFINTLHPDVSYDMIKIVQEFNR